MEETNAVIVFTLLVYLILGVGVGWLLTKFLKFALLLFMLVVLVAYGLYELDIMQLNEFAININMKGYLDPWYYLANIHKLLAFMGGVYLWRAHLRHL